VNEAVGVGGTWVRAYVGVRVLISVHKHVCFCECACMYSCACAQECACIPAALPVLYKEGWMDAS